MKPYRLEDPTDEDDQFNWPALESNPEVFSNYMTKLGMSEEWTIGEVYGFDEELLAFLPQPILGVIVAYEGLKNHEENEKGSSDDVGLVPFYMKQNS